MLQADGLWSAPVVPAPMILGVNPWSADYTKIGVSSLQYIAKDVSPPCYFRHFFFLIKNTNKETAELHSIGHLYYFSPP